MPATRWTPPGFKGFNHRAGSGLVHECALECDIVVVAILGHELTDARIALANAMYDRGRFADAAREARKLIALDPGRARSHGLLGLCLHRLGQDDAATVADDEALRLDPSDCANHYTWSIVLDRTNSHVAREAAREACRLAPDEGQPFRHLASLAIGARDAREARRAADGALRIDPCDPHALAMRALAVDALGFPSEAMADLRAALAAAPGDAYVRWVAGRLQERADPLASLRHYRDALSRAPADGTRHHAFERAAAKVRIVDALPARLRLLYLMPVVFASLLGVNQTLPPLHSGPFPLLMLLRFPPFCASLIALCVQKRRAVARIRRGD